MRGKLAGTVFQRSSSGLTMRTKTAQVNPRTSAQNSQRSIIYSLQKSWQLLTDEQRTIWNNFSRFGNFKGGLIDKHQLTGQQVFIKYNSPRLFCGYDLISVPPQFELSFPGFSVSIIQDETSKIFLRATGFSPDFEFSLIYRISQGMPQSRMYVPRSLCHGFKNGVDEQDIVINDFFLPYFGSIAAVGSRYYLDVYMIERDFGVMSFRLKSFYNSTQL